MPFPSFGEGKDAPIESGIGYKRPQPDHAPQLTAESTYLNLAVHSIFDPVAKATVGNEQISDELAGYACGFVKSLPLFMKGRLALAGLILTHAAGEAKVKDSFQHQITDAGLGSAKGLLLKGTFRAFSYHGVTKDDWTQKCSTLKGTTTGSYAFKNSMPNFRVDIEGRAVENLHEPDHGISVQWHPFNCDYSRN